jgi:hypothetical protein
LWAERKRLEEERVKEEQEYEEEKKRREEEKEKRKEAKAKVGDLSTRNCKLQVSKGLLSRTSMARKQCFGSGSGSSFLGRIPNRIQGFDDQKLKKIRQLKKIIFFV